MNTTQLGLITGLALGLAGAFGGVSAFLIVLLFGGIGLIAGRAIDGGLDLDSLLGRGRDR